MEEAYYDPTHYSLHDESRCRKGSGYGREPGYLPEVLRVVPDLPAQLPLALPARFPFLRLRGLAIAVKGEDDRLLLPCLRDLHEARPCHRVLLREAMRGFSQ